MRIMNALAVVLCVAVGAMAWNPTKVGQSLPMNRMMLDSDGELTSMEDMLAEGRPILVASNTTNCPYCDGPNGNLGNWLRNNAADRIKMTVVNVVHAFNQSAKMGYSNTARTGTDKGYVNDWRNRFPGFEYVRGFAINCEDQYFFPDEQGATPYWWVYENISNTFGYRGGGGDGWQGCRDYILGLYSAGKLTAFTSQCEAPSVTVAVNADIATVTVTSNQSGATVHYTDDGSIPSAASPVYTGPVTVRNSRLFRAQARKVGSYPSKVVIRAITAGTVSETNVAPQGTAYSWNNDYLTADLSNANRSALPGLNDGTITTDVRLHPTPGADYSDGDPAFRYATWQGGGIVWSSPVANVTRFEFIAGAVTGDWWGGHGCYFWNIKLELTFDGSTWVNADKWGYTAEFPFSKFYGSATGAYSFPSTQIVPLRHDPIVFFLGAPTTIRGFRIMGGFNVYTGYGQPDYVNVRELRAFQSSSVEVSHMYSPRRAVNAINVRVDDVSGRLTAQLPAGSVLRRASVCDISGRIVLTQSSVARSEVSMDISLLSAGTYLLTVDSDIRQIVAFNRR